jgi:hypothetical protein
MACCDSYFPKRTDLGNHAAEQLTSVASVLNRRPRKFLGWASPLEHLNRPAYHAQIHQPFAPTVESRRDKRALFNRHLNHQILK